MEVMKAFQIAGKNVIFADDQWRLVYSLWLHTDTVHDQLYIKHHHHHLLHIVIEDLGSLQTLLAAVSISRSFVRATRPQAKRKILDGGDCCEREDGAIWMMEERF